MTSRKRPQRRPPSGAGLLLLFLVLAGVVGMHALDTHGVSGHHLAGDAPHFSMQMPGAVPHASPSSRDGVEAPADGSAALPLCLGVLVASVLLLLVRRARNRAVVTLHPRWPVGVQGQLKPGRDRDPPSLTLLSLRRC